MKKQLLFLLFALISIKAFCQLNSSEKEKSTKNTSIRILVNTEFNMPFVKDVFFLPQNDIYSIEKTSYKTNKKGLKKAFDFENKFNNSKIGAIILFDNKKSNFDLLTGIDISKNMYKLDSLENTSYTKFNSVSPNIGIKYTTRKSDKAVGIAVITTGGVDYNFGFKSRDNSENHLVIHKENKFINPIIPYVKIGLFFEWIPGANKNTTQGKNSTTIISSTGKTMFLVGFNYSQNFNSLYNKNFAYSNGIKPFENFDSKYGYLSFSIKAVFGSNYNYTKTWTN